MCGSSLTFTPNTFLKLHPHKYVFFRNINTSGCVFVYHPHLNADNNGYFCKLIEKKSVMETYRFCNAPFIVGTREAFGNVDLKCVTYCRFQLGFRMFGRVMCPFQIKTRIK